MHSATVSPVPACHSFFAVLAWPSVPARPPISPTLPRAVQAWTGGEEPYTTARTSCTGPSCHWPTLPRTDLPCSPSARPALLPLPYRPGRTVRSPTTIPYRHATPMFSLPARSCFLAVPAWAHGEGSPTAIPYRHATPCVPCLYQKRFIYRLLTRHGCLPVWLVADE